MKKKFKNWLLSDNGTFGEGMSFSKMYLIFVIGSFIGVIYEEIIGFIKHHHIYGTWLWETRQGVIYGPFNPLYGAAIVLIILLLAKKKRNPAKTFLYGALLGGGIEYIISYLMELVLGAKSWNYYNRPLNINGRTTVLYMIFWGFAVMILIHYLYPYISKLIEKIPKKIGDIIVKFLVVFMTLNMVISWTALGRQVLRNKGYEPFTFVGAFYDKVYPDEFLHKIYPNMKFVD
ncbi:MAG: putative ABC transporter permease [Bacilli bacterium]|nr:putative ABC transporter permease [Bacilli bacterium]